MKKNDYPDTSLMGDLCSGKLGKLKQVSYLSRWKVVQCPCCGAIQVTEAKDRLTCMRCGKHRIFRMGGRWHVKMIEHTDDQQMAIRICKDAKMRETTKHDRFIEK